MLKKHWLCAAGLAFPGAGSLIVGRWGEALLALTGVVALAGLSLVLLVVANPTPGSSSTDLATALATLPSPPRVSAEFGLTLAVTLATHVMSAWGAAFGASRGTTPAESAKP